MYSEGFNFDALHKAYETGILSREDFGTDEEWAAAMDIFTEQMSEELEIPEVQEIADDYTNPNNWGLSPLRDAALLNQMAQNPDWDLEQLNTPLDPEIDEMISAHNNSSKNSEYPYLVPVYNGYCINDGTGWYPYDGDPNDWEGLIHGSHGDIRPKNSNIISNSNIRTFDDFQADYQDFDWDNDYVESGFPDGQFLGNGLDAQGSAFLSECWRSHNTDGAYDYIEQIADDDLRSKISRIYDTCDGSTVDRSQFEFVWEQERLEEICDDFYGLHS